MVAAMQIGVAAGLVLGLTSHTLALSTNSDHDSLEERASVLLPERFEEGFQQRDVILDVELEERELDLRGIKPKPNPRPPRPAPPGPTRRPRAYHDDGLEERELLGNLYSRDLARRGIKPKPNPKPRPAPPGPTRRPRLYDDGELQARNVDMEMIDPSPTLNLAPHPLAQPADPDDLWNRVAWLRSRDKA
ncbi:unnamed protein product [Clonostachys rosea]|uniref:Uncharacterized protein n=1 Tax=Bionectria ochroleuca TaxID=29856 RepID=A0ABY6TXR2_BIOOC|nr:unnamed protein product [Clonostachys rosea]